MEGFMAETVGTFFYFFKLIFLCLLIRRCQLFKNTSAKS